MRSMPSAPPGCGELNQFLDEKYRGARLAKEKAERKVFEEKAEKAVKEWLKKGLEDKLYGDLASEIRHAVSQRRAK